MRQPALQARDWVTQTGRWRTPPAGFVFATDATGEDRDLRREPGRAPPCPRLNGNVDSEGAVSFDDINPFVECSVNGGCP
jgi:hypothetical protein